MSASHIHALRMAAKAAKAAVASPLPASQVAKSTAQAVAVKAAKAAT